MRPEQLSNSLFHTHRAIAVDQKRVAQAQAMRFATCARCGAEVFARQVIKHGQLIWQLFDRDLWLPHKFGCKGLTARTRRAAA